MAYMHAAVNPLAVVPYRPPGLPTVQIHLPSYTGNTVTLVCTVTSNLPIIYVWWLRNDITITSTTNFYKYIGSTPTTPSLTILCVDLNDAGQYICYASNCVGIGQSLPITLGPPTVQVQQLLNPVTIGSTVTLPCIVISSSLPITHVYWLRNHGGNITIITSTTNIYKYRGSTLATPSLTILIDDLNDAGQYKCCASSLLGTGESLPIPLTLYIPSIHITYIKQLGSGQFGEVCLGKLMNREVAIKTPKWNQVENAKIGFIKEVQQMIRISHQNIVILYGIFAENCMMVLEYMKNGDLLNYLRRHRTYPPTLSITQLYHIAKQISAGMVYLASKGFVHRDLAARNCLVGQNLVAKIGDFGLCRDVYSTDFYTAGNSDMLPIKWMAPESVQFRIFTVKSDVWSFAVLLWEIFTYGGEPWFGMTNYQVTWYITNGFILYQPNTCPDAVYEIMKNCWRRNTEERLTMKDVHEKIEMSETLYLFHQLPFQFN